MSTDTPAQVAAIVVPWPERADDNDDYFNDLCETVVRERMELADTLRASWEEGEQDPVLVSILEERRAMLRHEETMRALLAYAREFTKPRPYTLGALAEASGMSISGIRTAYGEEEIAFVRDQMRHADLTLP